MSYPPGVTGADPHFYPPDERDGVVVTDLICEGCGYRGDREVEEGVPDECVLCGSQETRRP